MRKEENQGEAVPKSLLPGLSAQVQVPGSWQALMDPVPSPLFLLFQLFYDLSAFVFVMPERVAVVKAALPSRNIIPPVRRIGLDIGMWMSAHDYPHSLFPLGRWKNKSAR